MDYNIWYSGRWKNYINPEEYKGGLRIHLPEKMENSVREAVKKFCRFLRKEYTFPIRVQIYIKAYKNISNNSSAFNIQKSWENNYQEMRVELKVPFETLKSEKEIFVLIIVFHLELLYI